MTGYFIGFVSLTHVETGSNNFDLSNPKKKGAEYLSRPLLLITRCTVETKKSLVCLMKQSAMLTTNDPGIGLAFTQAPLLLRTSRPPAESWVTIVKHSTSVCAPMPFWSSTEWLCSG